MAWAQEPWYQLNGLKEVASLEQVLNDLEQRDTEEGLRVASQALTMATWHHDSVVVAFTQFRITRFLKLLSRHDSAKSRSKLALALKEVLPDKYKVHLYNEIGDIAMQTGQLDDAMGWYLNALQLCHASSLSALLVGETYYCIGWLHLTRFEYDTAHHYFNQSLNKHQLEQDKEGEARAINGIGLIYMRKDSFLLARQYFFQSLDLLSTLHKPRFEAKLYNNIGITYEDMGEPKTAIMYYEKSLRIKEKLKDLRGIASTYGNLSDNFRQIQDFENALLYNQRSMELSEQLHALEFIVTARKRAFLIYEDMGRYKEALKAHKMFKKAEDSLNSKRSREHINTLIAEYEVEKNALENSKLKELSEQQLEAIRQQKILLGIAIIGIVVVLVLVLITFKLYKRYRILSEHLSDHQTALSEANTSLRMALHENHVVTGILVHDLRAPLIRMKGLVDIMMRSTLPAEEQTALFERMSEQLRQGQHIIQDLLLLEREEAPDPVEFELNAFVQDILTFYQAESYRKDIALQLFPSSTPIVLFQDQDTVRRILDNLLSNALKFNPEGGSVVVKIRRSEVDALVYISDDGPGFTAEDKAHMFKRFAKLTAQPTGGETSTGLGLAIVRKLTQQLKGTIVLVEEVEKGATFELTLPLRFEVADATQSGFVDQSSELSHTED